METTWASLTIPLIVGALIILIPGLIVALAMRQRGVEALGLAAPISVGIFGVSAIFASKVGVRFSFLIPLAFGVFDLPSAWQSRLAGFSRPTETARSAGKHRNCAFWLVYPADSCGGA